MVLAIVIAVLITAIITAAVCACASSKDIAAARNEGIESGKYEGRVEYRNELSNSEYEKSKADVAAKEARYQSNINTLVSTLFSLTPAQKETMKTSSISTPEALYNLRTLALNCENLYPAILEGQISVQKDKANRLAAEAAAAKKAARKTPSRGKR